MNSSRRQGGGPAIEGVATAILLGSGMAAVSNAFPVRTAIPFEAIEGVGCADVDGHDGEIRHVEVRGKNCLMILGRRHFYERAVSSIGALIAFLSKAGVERLLLTSAAGSVQKAVPPGMLVLVDDIANLQLTRVGARSDAPGQGMAFRPADTCPALDADMKRALWAAAARAGVPLERGTAVSCQGPAYETAAEVQMLQRHGATIVTMSGAAEIAFARSFGIHVAMIGLVTNWATGLSTAALHHRDVLDTGERTAGALRRLIVQFLAP